MRGLRFGLAFVAAFAMAGCASVTGGNVQKMYVQAQMADGSAVSGADCVLSNDKGRWPLRSPGDASVVRSNKPMEVKCEKAAVPTGVVSVESGTRAAMFGNIILGGVVGAVIDHSSGAAYEYPEQVRVVMGQMKSLPWVSGPRPDSPSVGPAGLGAPQAAPSASALGDAAAVPYLGPKGRDAYREWAVRPNPKAFAIAPNGHYWASWGERPADATLPIDVTERAVAGCSRSAQVACKLYAVNDAVVWAEERAAPATLPVAATASTVQAPLRGSEQPARIASGYAAIDDVDAIPYLSDRGRDDYRQWLTRPTPKAFAISTHGHWFGAWSLKPGDPSHPTDPTERALFVCSQRAQAPCQLYAVNGSVVWKKDVRVSQP